MIRRMTRISNQYGAVNLSQGFPDFEPPKEILERLAQVTKEDFHQYATTWGSQNFRDAVAAKQKRFMGYDIDPNSEIVVTCGSTEAMMAAMLSVTNPGDKVIVFSPFYENYGADAILSGAEPIYVPLVPPEYSFDADVLEAAFRQHPKALILCNPSNPCGKVFTREELQIIADLAEKYDTYVITDEVYEHILYAPNRHVYFSTLPGMRKRTICCSSLSKTYSRKSRQEASEENAQKVLCPAFWSLQPAYKRKFPRADGKPCTGESIQKKAATYSPALQAVPSA